MIESLMSISIKYYNVEFHEVLIFLGILLGLYIVLGIKD